jgi:formylglycine-generating enzyme required for sulfatase activity
MKCSRMYRLQTALLSSTNDLAARRVYTIVASANRGDTAQAYVSYLITIGVKWKLCLFCLALVSMFIPEMVLAQTAGPSAEAVSIGKTFKDCDVCPEMVMLPIGSFQMGGNKFESEKPTHAVVISRQFALGKTAVTQGQWKAIMGTKPSHFSCGADCPVEQVSWNDAQDFLRRLSQKTGKTYRLPSEAEWEYGCRAGGQQEYCGTDNLGLVGWYVSNSGSTTHPVAGKQANAWGLYDMSGNVWQWTEDCWNNSYNGAPTDGSGWTSGECTARVLRGGSWFSLPQVASAAFRHNESTCCGSPEWGFRVSRDGDFYVVGSPSGNQMVIANMSPEASTRGDGSIDHINQQQATRASWENWLANMRAEFDMISASNVAPNLLVTAWERFQSNYSQDDPYSWQDKLLRTQAQRKMQLATTQDAAQQLEKMNRQRKQAEEPSPPANSAIIH